MFISILTNIFIVSCALLSGAHFIATKPNQGFGSVPDNTTGDDRKFFGALPSVVVNEFPLPIEEVKKKIVIDCKCDRYCWNDKEGPLFKPRPLNWTATVVRGAIEAYLATLDVSAGTILSSDDLRTSPANSFLPLVPDVAIQ